MLDKNYNFPSEIYYFIYLNRGLNEKEINYISKILK